MAYRKLSLTALSALSLFLSIGPANADAYYDEGLKRFGKKDYKTAAAYFEQSILNAPWDSNAFYYAGYSYQMLGDWNKAKEKYGVIVDRFPGTQACINATAVLKKVDPAYFSRKRPTGDGATAKGGAAESKPTETATESDPYAAVVVSGPAQSRLPFQKSGDKMYVDIQVNGRTFKAAFGIGSERTTIPKKDWVAAGFPLPKTAPTRKTGQSNPSWEVTGTVKVGEVSQKNLPVDISEGADSVTLGEGFFKKVSYIVDQNANQIKMSVKGAPSGASAAATGYDLPFKKEGNDMVVNVTVNGRSCSMVFDATGGDIVIPKKRAREFGIDVQENQTVQGWGSGYDPNGPQRGDPGFGDLKRDIFGEITVRVGPISRSGVKAKIDETGTVAKVGAAVFGDWQYSIDQTAKVIRFHR